MICSGVLWKLNLPLRGVKGMQFPYLQTNDQPAQSMGGGSAEGGLLLMALATASSSVPQIPVPIRQPKGDIFICTYLQHRRRTLTRECKSYIMSRVPSAWEGTLSLLHWMVSTPVLCLGDIFLPRLFTCKQPWTDPEQKHSGPHVQDMQKHKGPVEDCLSTSSS